MIRIAARFCGPPESGNGGYCAGRLARQFQHAFGHAGAVEVTLRKPPPLERDLSVELAGERALLQDGQELIAEARATELDVTPPPAPSFEEASAQATHYVGHVRHHFPTCFVCGPARVPGDGLRIFPGKSNASAPVAAPWIPDESLAARPRELPSEVLWAALDCAGYFAVGAPDYPIALLGRMTARILSAPEIGERSVVVGWSLGRDGRKLSAGTALFGQSGKLHASALQTWILVGGSVPPPPSKAH